MIYFFSLNELLLPRFLILILLGRSVKVLRIAPFVAKMEGVLKRLVDWLIASGRTEYAVSLTPELQTRWDFQRRFYFQEVFKKYEPWQNDYYGFTRDEIAGDPVYGYAFKKMTCSYTFWKVIEIYLIRALVGKLPAGTYRTYGALPDTMALGDHLFGPGWAPGVRSMAYPSWAVRLGQALLATVYTFAFLISRVRLIVKTQKIDVAFDRMKDLREDELLAELSGAGSFLLIDRFPRFADTAVPEGLDYQTCGRLDGYFTPFGAMSGAAMACRDIWLLSRRHRNDPPALYYEMLTLPYKRLLIRGLLNRFRPNFFVGRDEYNVDHVLRRAELTWLGIKSIGINNALYPCFSSLAPNIRYVSYDTYYVSAPPLFTQYHETWAPDMAVRPLGAYSVPREKLTAGYRSQGADIVFTIRVAWDRPELVNMVRAVAQAFPERTIYLQFKAGFVGDEDVRKLVAACGTGLDNFTHTTEDVYSLLDRAAYHVSDISTFVAEAICTGMVTIVIDLLDMEFNCFRLFPDLCVTKADELVDKLLAFESGKAIYPHEIYYEYLGHREGEIGYDLLRDEITSRPGQTNSKPC